MKDKPLFLAPKGRGGDGLGYLNEPLRELHGTEHHVDSPETIERVASATSLCDEPEAVGPAILDAFGQSARFYETIRHAANVERAREARLELSLEQRVRGAEERAKRQHINVSGELHVIQCMVARAVAGGRKQPTAAIKRLERLEAQLDGMSLAA